MPPDSGCVNGYSRMVLWHCLNRNCRLSRYFKVVIRGSIKAVYFLRCAEVCWVAHRARLVPN